MKLNKAQKDVLMEEIHSLAQSIKSNIDVLKCSVEIIILTRILLGEITMSEHIYSTSDAKKKKYYQDLMINNQAPSTYVKRGYGPNHGKGLKHRKA